MPGTLHPRQPPTKLFLPCCELQRIPPLPFVLKKKKKTLHGAAFKMETFNQVIIKTLYLWSVKKKPASEESRKMSSELLLFKAPEDKRTEISWLWAASALIFNWFNNACVRFKADQLSATASSISIKLHLAGRRSTRFIFSQPLPKYTRAARHTPLSRGLAAKD